MNTRSRPGGPGDLEDIAELRRLAPRGRLPARVRGAERLLRTRRSSRRSAARCSTRTTSSASSARGRASARSSFVALAHRARVDPRGRRRRARDRPVHAGQRRVRHQRAVARGGSRRQSAAALPRRAAPEGARDGPADAAVPHGRGGDALAAGAQRAEARALARFLAGAAAADPRREVGRARRPRGSTWRCPTATRSSRVRTSGQDGDPDADVARDARGVGAGERARSARCSRRRARPSVALAEAQAPLRRRRAGRSRRALAVPALLVRRRCSRCCVAFRWSARERAQPARSGAELAARRRPRLQVRARTRSLAVGVLVMLPLVDRRGDVALRRQRRGRSATSASRTTSTSSPRAAGRSSRSGSFYLVARS